MWRKWHYESSNTKPLHWYHVITNQLKSLSWWIMVNLMISILQHIVTNKINDHLKNDGIYSHCWCRRRWLALEFEGAFGILAHRLSSVDVWGVILLSLLVRPPEISLVGLLECIALLGIGRAILGGILLQWAWLAFHKGCSCSLVHLENTCKSWLWT